MLLRVLVVVVLVVLAGYGFAKALPLIEGPQIALTSPQSGQSFADGYALISGVARHTQDLSLNGAPLLIDQDGAFRATLVLPTGGAILTLTATDRFGRTETERREIYIP